uniref:Rne/Rng family ribonuclease n=1 Tax=Nocardiopsis gilva TaxID=280236 RepID=UPI00035CB6D9
PGTATRASRKTRARGADEPAGEADAEPTATAEPSARDEAAAATDEAASSASFQPPMVLFQPPVAPAPGTAAETAATDEGAEDTEAEQAASDEPTEDARSAETGEERTSRRRRRRGGRGRGKSRTGEEESEAERAPSAATAKASGDEAAEKARENGEAEQQPEDEGGESAAGGSRRRRRRRRRSSGEGAEEAPGRDDPPNTVVRVREPRAEKPIEDEVQAVRGSTRLEAKKQRRREGREQGRRRTPVITESEFLARRESVKRDLVIRRTGERTQIGVLEDDVLVEHYVDRATHRSYVGNVYLGRVQNVLPSMEAAFVDIGKGRNAVLYAGEVNWDASGLEGQPKRIESVLKSGQSVLVQVTKDPMGHKGARLTSQISLPGRYLVYVPDGSMTGISRKLPDKERARLKQILKKVMPENAGVIVRTAAEGASEEELERDISRLAAQWDSIKRKSKSATAPSLLNSEPDLTVRVVRDVFNEDFASLVVSGDEAWDTVHEYVEYVAPHLSERVSKWGGDRDIFEAYRVDEQIGKALERKVWLPSGGSLIIDRTEAMTVVDVNTGKFTGQGGNLEETVTKNNLEAAEEIVRQLRLRDIGGIIVIDFIDMVLESNRDLVLRRMLECLSRDRTKHQVAEVTSLGLVQMTRKRVGQGLLEAFSTSCEHCNGRGLLVSSEPIEAKSGGGATGNGKKKKAKGGAAAEKAESGEKAAEEPKPETAPEAAAAPAAEEAPAAPTTAKKAKAKAKTKAADTSAAEETAAASAPAEEAEQAEAPAEEPKKAARTTKAKTAKAAPKKKAATTAKKTSRKAKKEEETAADAETAAPAPVEAAPLTAAADGAGESGETERPRRRRTRRTKATTSTESPVAEAG